MTKNHPSMLNNGEVLNQRLEHLTHVMLDMNDFLVPRFMIYIFVIFKDDVTMFFSDLIMFIILSCRFSLIQRYTIKTSQPLYLL